MVINATNICVSCQGITNLSNTCFYYNLICILCDCANKTKILVLDTFFFKCGVLLISPFSK